MRLRTGVIAAVAAASLLALTVVPAASAEDYPTWDEVEAARSSAAATSAEVDRISDFITSLTAESARLGRITIEKGAAYTVAKAELDAATRRADVLVTQRDTAVAEAADAHDRYGAIVSQLVVSGGTESLTVQLLLDHSSDTDLLYRLGAMTKLTQQAAGLEDRAESRSNEADALSAQAAVAEKERDKLAAAAQTALEEAQAAEQEAGARLAAQKEASATLQAQLASLTAQAADVEKRYTEGEAARKAAEAAAAAAAAEAAAAAAAAAEAAGDGGGGGGGGATPIYTGDVDSDPGAAQAYAAGAIGAYGWGGDQFGCLQRLWNKESGWRADAYNASSGAYGIPQSLPGEKMASAGVDWRTNAGTQINWGLSYIAQRYGSPCGAWDHSVVWNWY
ncbi:coiled-coil domain-containing protein [Leifsonia flava]|uniref:Lytic transglycosylase domain-containing protein n=1 Tax=Orlajensenia leifsoniae TaxID=2561933 RepID=A0A4Y9R584_9MICO|nr:lytic transglycosylase domain-containing protein [Leifsonia flava]TFV99072.1 lytic transglycosylase domain-containing protein [Leifsonia flava]